ncbi:MAG: AAA family ATPase, partial [Candidatus Omnitrophota bacterium]
IKEDLQKETSSVIDRQEVLDHVSEEEARRGTLEIDKDSFKDDERANLLKLEEMLSKRVIHQEEAIRLMSENVRIGRAGLKDPKAPLASFVFAGPTGVGKTQLTKTLAEVLGMQHLRIDMSEYQTKADVARLIGAPPGYVSYDEKSEGFLFEHMKRYPKSLVVFDEADKAYFEIFNVLLQVMEDGRLTSNKGNTIYFNEAIIVLTTNLGMQVFIEKDGERIKISLMDKMEEAIRSRDAEKISAFKKAMTDQIMAVARKFFRPEFLNRLDGFVIFNPLELDLLNQIAAIFLKETIAAFESQQGVHLVIGQNDSEREEIYTYLVNLGYSPEYGARPIKKDAIEKKFETPLSQFVIKNQGRIKKGDTIAARLVEGEIAFEIKETQEKDFLKEIPEKDREILQGISEFLTRRPTETISYEDLEEIFGFRTEVGVKEGEGISFSDKAKEVVLDNVDFYKKDERAIEAREEIAGEIAEEDLAKRIKAWIKFVVQLAKMASLEAYLYREEKRVIKGFYERRKNEYRDETALSFEKIMDSCPLTLKWEIENNVLKIAVIFDARLTRYLARKLFTTEYADKEDIERKAPRNLMEFLLSSNELKKAGAEVNFSAGEKTSLWLKIRLPEPVVEKPEAGIPAEETAQLKEKRQKLARLKAREAELEEGIKLGRLAGQGKIIGLDKRPVKRSVGGWIWSVAFSPNNKSVLVGSEEGKGSFRIYNLARDKKGRIVGLDKKLIKRIIGESVRSLAFSSDNKAILVGTIDGFRIYNLVCDRKGRIIRMDRNPIACSVGGWIWSAAFSSDNKAIIVGRMDRFRLYNLARDKKGRIVSLDDEPIEGPVFGVARSVAFSFDNKVILVGTDDNSFQLYNLARDESGRIVGLDEKPIERSAGGQVRSGVISSDNKAILVGSEDGPFRLYNLEHDENGRIVRLDGEPIEGSVGGGVWSVAFSSDNKAILVGSKDGPFRLYNLEYDENGRIARLDGEPIEGSVSGRVRSVAFSFDNKAIMVGSDNDTSFQIYNLERDGRAAAEEGGSRNGEELKDVKAQIANLRKRSRSYQSAKPPNKESQDLKNNSRGLKVNWPRFGQRRASRSNPNPRRRSLPGSPPHPPRRRKLRLRQQRA